MTTDNETKLRSRLVRALREVERLREKTDSLEAATSEPIAIVGIGLRLPGGANDLDGLWRLLEAELDAVKQVPRERWNADDWYDPDPDAIGKAYAREAGFLDQIDQFDPAFFSISPREAKSIDPMHRLLLEVAWEALERAAIVPASLADSSTGVFVGVGSSDYQRMQTGEADAHVLTGTQMSFAAGRVAFHLGLQGPAISVDTACSSSLVALHLACNALRENECGLALVGGVSVLADPQAFVQLSRTRALAPDGRCKTFSANADGYGRGEGAVMLALERLSDAQKHGREILAVVRGTAVNHDGASSGITAPNGTSQQKVLRAALADAKIGPADVDFVECHGTGTKLGDPIEVQALASVYAADRPSERPLLLGAIKTNIGHLEAAAGLAGVAKVIASMRHQALPASNHSNPRNPHIDWASMPVKVVDELQPWLPRTESPRRAGVSGFGLSGTNAHVILEEAPPSSTAPSQPAAFGGTPLLVSGRSEAAVAAQAERLHALLVATPDVSVLDLGFSLATGRTLFEHRAAVLAHDLAEATDALASLAKGAGPRIVHARPSPKLAVLFTGQGSQRQGMGEGLYAGFPVFRAAFDEICALFDPLLEAPLRPTMFSGAAGELDRTAYTQPALFALEVALFRLYAAWGLRPQVLLGHSIGELAAAHVAGVFSLEDACRLVAARGRSMQALPSGGAMVSLQAEEREVAELLGRHVGVEIAGINGPMSTVISGDEGPVAELAAYFSAMSRKTTRLVVSHAFHSHHMEPMLAEFRKVAESIRYARPTISVISNVTGAVARADELMAPEYWVRQVRSAVRFFDGVQTIERMNVKLLLELGPHAVLAAMATGCLSEAGQASTAIIAAQRRDHSEVDAAVGALARLSCEGAAVDWSAFYEPQQPRRLALPTYPFQRQRHWFDATPAARHALARPTAGDFALSGERVDLANGVVLHTLEFGPGVQSYLGDHVVYGHIVVPGAFYVAVLLAIAESHWPGQPIELRNVEFVRALTFRRSNEQVPLYAELTPLDGASGFSVVIFTRHDGERTERALARIAPAADGRPTHARLPSRASQESDFSDFRALLGSVHIEWGPKWWWLRQVDVSDRTALARLAAREGVPPDDAPIPGGFIDNSFALLVWTRGQPEVPDDTPQLPFSLSRLVWYGRRGTPAFAKLEHVEATADTTTSNIVYWDDEGEPIGHVEYYTARRAPLERFIRPQSSRNLYYVGWTELRLAAPAQAHDVVVLGRGELEIPGSRAFADVAALAADVARGGACPAVVVQPLPPTSDDPLTATDEVLRSLQTWLADDRLASCKLVIVTQRAIASETHEGVADLAHAPVWGLIRSAQSEYADRALAIIDIDGSAPSLAALPAALASTETQLCLRGGVGKTPRLSPLQGRKLLEPPTPTGWRLDIPRKGSIDGLVLTEYGAALEPLPAGHVRIAPRVVGLNFRDVLNVLDMYPGDAGPLGGEGGAVVLEVASDVRQFAPGDRVMGMFPRAFSDVTIGDARRLFRMPDHWSFADAATVAVVYLTAYWGLVELGRVEPGQRVLVHAAAGGVGIAAVQLAKHLGAEIFATASPSKWPILRRLGLPDSHIASSRDLAFEAKFMAATAGQGMHVVLNSLADEFLDASLRLLPSGGCFLEMGKIDLREAAQVAVDHPGVRYVPYDILTIPDDDAQRVFAALEQLFASGTLGALPFAAWDVRLAPEAFRFMAQARHVGKVVLGIARPLDRNGTVLITGATGALGSLLARHLVAQHGVRSLMLVSRRGEQAPNAPALLAELRGMGASVQMFACDAADRDALAAVLAELPEGRPLTGVFHTAGALDDGVLSALDRDRLALVFAAKVAAAQHLHELTAGMDLAAFVLFSSLAGLIGSAGQASYAAANVYLDALCAQRRALGLPGTSLAWGPWAEGGMAARLSEADKARVARGGFPLLGADEGLQLLDAALARPEALIVPVEIDSKTLATNSTIPPLLRGLVRVASKRPQVASESSNALARRLAGMNEGERTQHLIEVVRGEAATVLALPSGDSMEPDVALQEYGLDSLMAVELRNRLQALSGLRLSSTFLFDYPTARVVAKELGERLSASVTASAPDPTAPVLRAVADADDEQAIAIVAMGCRLPGGIESPEALWTTLIEGIDQVSTFPADRGWPLATLHDPDPDRPGTTYTTGGGFIQRPDGFDADFFGISPREAEAIDPQQRILLELSWEVLERATIDPATLGNSLTGVYVGVCYHDYATLAPDAAHATDGYAALGSASSTASGRISYTLGLQGPSISVDTACSTSLVALHLAAQALRNRECDLALAGGATVFATPDPLIFFSRLKALSPDGRCKSFSAEADGAGWAEGAAMLLLERVADARANGHPILALVRGSAINQDGRSQGLTAPNGPAQQRVIQTALASAGLTPADVDVVEAHGTGTKLGDPIEAGALHATYGHHHDVERPLWLGSLKSNIGHTQAAAGVAGIIKVVLAMQHALLPRTLHAERPSSFIDWDGTIQLLNEPRAWPSGAAPRRAAVSAFGISGTNAHVIIEEAREPQPPSSAAIAPAPAPMILSARSEAALAAAVVRLRDHWQAHPKLRTLDLAYSLVTTRSMFEHRACVVADRPSALDERGFSTTATTGPSKLALLFTGQGSQRLGMGLELHRSCAVFRSSFDEICAQFEGLLDVPLREVVFAQPRADAPALIDSTSYTQPALFALEVALFQQLAAWGVRPDILLGHSIGELAAAHVAQVWSLADACRLVAARAKLMQALRTDGAMVSISASESEVMGVLGDRVDVGIAALNGPSSTVISGDEAAVLAISSQFAERGRSTRRLNVSHAFHSHHMDGMLGDFLAVARSLEYSPPQIPVVSNVTGRLASADELCDPGYWVRHVRGAVRFHDGVATLEAEQVRACLELGPHGVLSSMAADGLSEAGRARVSLLPAVRRDRPELETLTLALGSLHCCGVAVDWHGYFGPEPRRVELPSYPFQRQHFWLERADGPLDGGSLDVAGAGLSSVEHGLLRAMTPIADDGEWLFSTTLSSTATAWLLDHRVFDRVVFPGAGFVELALAAARQTWPNEPAVALDEVVLTTALVLDEPAQLQIVLDAEDAGGRRAFRIFGRRASDPSEPLVQHASGRVGPARPQRVGPPTWPPKGTAIDVEALYARLAELGLGYGSGFRGLRRVWREASGDLYAEVSIDADASAYGLHPALLDAVFQVALCGADLEAFARTRTVTLPFAVVDLQLFATACAAVRVHARSSERGMAFELWDGAGELVARIAALEARSASVEALQGREPARHVYRLAWEPDADAAAIVEPGERWTVIGEGGTFEDARRFASWEAFEAGLEPGVRHEGVIVRIWPRDDEREHDRSEAAHAIAEQGLRELQRWLARPELDGARLLWLTQRAVAASPGEAISSLSCAPLWGLARVAMNESRDRELRMLDLDGAPTLESLQRALASEDRELLLRGGTRLVPRLQPVQDPSAEAIALSGTTLITGGTGTLGARVARRLVQAHAVEHLLLLSRRGADAQSTSLVDELRALGAQTVEVIACDVADREALARLLATIPSERPLRAVIHAAGVLEDAVLPNLGPEQLHRVLRAKIDGAWNLHTLTAELELQSFVSFSSAAGIFGNAGQANYAAANTFLDALAQLRRAGGQPALSLAWGPWADGGMAARLDEGDQARLRRSGVRPLSDARGEAAFGSCLAATDALLVPIELDVRALQRLRDRGELARALFGLVGRGIRAAQARTEPATSLLERLASTPAPEQQQLVDAAIGAEITSILHRSEPLAPDQPLQDYGLDSLMAVELRNRLQRVTGLRLPSTLLFEHPTPRELGLRILAELREQLPDDSAAAPAQADSTTASIQLIRSKRDPSSATVDQWHNLLARMVSLPQADIATVLGMFAAITKVREFQGLITEVPPARPIQLTRQRAGLTVFCHPTYAPPASAFQYLQLAESMNGRATVWSSSLLGYGLGSLLPGSWDLQVRHQHAALMACAGNQPVVLLAHSAGGLFSYYHAAYMESLGTPPLAVVMLDTFYNGDVPGETLLPSFIRHTTDHLLHTGSDRADHELVYEFSAFVNTQQQLDNAWATTRPVIQTPTLFIQCPYVSEDVPTATHPELWRAQISDFSLISTNLNHFQLITDTDTTTRLIFDWLREKGLWDQGGGVS